METRPDQPENEVSGDEEIVTEEMVKAETEDTPPLTLQETVERAKKIGHTAKYGILRPGWNYIRNALEKADETTDRSIKGFFDGFKEKQDEDKK